jgi:hypothetical protein
MRKVTLKRVDHAPDSLTLPQSYSMDLTVIAADDMPKEVFVKQRFGVDDDRFAAIASPEQLESLPVDAPDTDTSYFRTASVSLVAANQATLEEIYSMVVAEIQLLTANLDALAVSALPDKICEITAISVTSV